MKKFIFVLVINLLSSIIAVNAFAASPTSTASSSAQQLLNDLQDYLSKHPITEKRGILGKVTDVSDTQITLTDIKDNTRFVDVDELTKFQSDRMSNFGVSDIKKGSTLSVLGLYNKQSRRILARSISEISFSKMINGNVATVDADNFVFHIATDRNEQFEISVETTTKTLSYNSASQNLIRSGFSKLKVGEKVFVRGSLDPKNDKLISSNVIIIFPDIVKGGLKPEVSPSIVPSTGSGKKLTPIVK